MRSVRRFGALVVSASLALAACGEGPSPRERISEAADVTAAEGTAAFTLEIDVDMGSDGPGMQTSITGEGVADLESRRGRMEMSYPGLGGSMTTVFDGDAVFVRVPAGLTGGETRWVRRSSEGGSAMVPGSRMGQDPLGFLDALDAMEGEIRTLDADTVGETEVQGFAFTLAGHKLWGESEGEDGEDAVPDALRDLEIPAEAWLDDRGRVRRLVMEIDLATMADVVRSTSGDTAPGGLGGMLGAIEGTLTVTTALRDFGTPVEVETPDEADVISEEELQRLSRERAGAPGGSP